VISVPVVGRKVNLLRRDAPPGHHPAQLPEVLQPDGASLGLGPAVVPQIVHAMETKPRTPVIWLHGLECTCCTERSSAPAHPLVSDVILSMISLDYDDTIMAAAGPAGPRDPRRDDREVRRQVHPRGRGQPAAERGRHVLHPAASRS
jgi:hypothetical protein